jgi:hypothetical protein
MHCLDFCIHLEFFNARFGDQLTVVEFDFSEGLTCVQLFQGNISN